ncbi:MAG: tRNA (cytidine(34)-2'-O)-methyltransferase [Acidobacteria bacterium]|nr:tRNA (cytidine(34)-2'-O)-methyltransferase [Acidobacteriota bacterium]
MAPEIHWNTGNVGRTCLAAGARLHLIEPLGFSLGAKEIRRAGLDYWPHVQPRLWPDWQALERCLPELGEPYFFTVAAEQTYWQPSYPNRTVLVFGGETRGLPAAIRQRYERRLVAIPQDHRRVRSLNLSSCVGIGVYEVLRQRRQPGLRLSSSDESPPEGDGQDHEQAGGDRQ